MPVDTRLTYEDLCALPNDGKRYEIIEGELFVTPAPRSLHQVVVANLHLALGQFVKSQGLGRVFLAPLDVVLSEFDVVEPDLLYISKAHGSRLTEANLRGAPDLAIEVLSETSAKLDRTAKLKLYARFGVQEYWIIDPDGPSAEIYRHKQKRLAMVSKLSASGTLSSPLFPGFSLLLRELVD
ncbi:MAG: Uma2 family endonuclease [Acidobacteriia bacterium]|nr:Uma2 family endonuclease [Terriglobia bacterium]